MADDWEDWESESYVPPALASAAAPKPAVSSLAEGIDMSKFADEEKAVVEEKTHIVPTSQPKKKEEKKYMKEVSTVDDTPLDDPEEEKLRQQRMQEEAEFRIIREQMGNLGNELNLDSFLPKSVKDFDELATALCSRHVIIHKDNKNFKAYLKALIKGACATLTSTEVKDIETSLAGLRSEKFKAEQAEAAAKKGTKKQLNVGKSAGLDDYLYEDAGGGDDYDFM